jgi:predicted tellurium resistance membrane protein TerC
MGAFLTSDGLIALGTLTALEIVLGVDNLVFIAIVAAKLPAAQQPLARRIGLGLALITRVLLLLTLSWIMGLTKPMFSLAGHGFSGRDLILLAGGLFLMAKATWEIYAKVEGAHEEAHAAGVRRGLAGVVVQIMILDIVFSLDSVITAVGMVDDVPIMITAIVLAMIVMLFAMDAVSGFVERHPSVKILALSFLLLIGVVLVADGFGHHMPKGYVYFPMAFSLGVELLNLRYRTRRARRS